MGSKAKFWFDHPELGTCLFKEARLRTGEDWSEKVAAELAELMELPHARYELAVSEGARGVITPRLTQESEELVHGNELLIELDPTYGQEPTQYRTPAHTVSSVARALRESGNQADLPAGWNLPDGIEDAVGLLCGYLLLDALIGNTDRHHENWALIRSAGKGKQRRFRVAPTFDHASSLGRNEPLKRVRERLVTNDQNFTVEAYAARARSALFSSADDSVPLAPIEAFSEVAKLDPKAARAWCERVQRVTDEGVDRILQQVPEARMPLPYKEFVIRMLRFNRQEILSICEVL